MKARHLTGGSDRLALSVRGIRCVRPVDHGATVLFAMVPKGSRFPFTKPVSIGKVLHCVVKPLPFVLFDRFKDSAPEYVAKELVASLGKVS